MQTKKTKIIKLISSFLIIAILAPSFLFLNVKRVEAVPVSDVGPKAWFRTIFTGKTAVATTANTAVTFKNVSKEILRQIVMTITRRLLAEMTKSTVNWINSGFHGAPLFLERPESFFKDIGKYEIKNFITSTGYDSNRFPFGKGFALGVIGAYKQKFEDNAQYTLSKVINDPALLNSYRTNFNVGGWNGFLTNAMYPQNNYIGYQMLATEQLAKKLENKVNNKIGKVQEALNQGMGFLSPETCADNGGNNDYNKVAANQFKRPSFKPTTKYGWKAPAYQKLGKCTLLTIGFTTPQVINTTEGVCKDKGGNWVTDYSTWQNESEGDYGTRYDEEKVKYDAEHSSKIAQEKTDWAEKNTCKNLVATTPGSVVADQIMGALGSSRKLGELGTMLGGSMSAIFDALLNKFIGSGLNALATKTNPRAVEEDFEYEGQKLGVTPDGKIDDWSTGPDEEISLDLFKKQLDGYTQRVRVGSIIEQNEDGSERNVAVEGQIVIEVGDARSTTGLGLCSTREETVKVSKADCDNASQNLKDANDKIFPPGNWTDGNGKKYIPGDIANTQKEIALIDNSAIKNPGIIQMISKTWPEIRELDMCIPGPNMGWEERLTKEMDRNSSKLQEKASEQNGEKAAAAQLVYNELEFAVKSFKDWIDNKMIMSLGNSQIYMDAIDEIDTLYQQSKEIIDSKRIKNQALARLLSIKADLDKLTLQPDAGSNEEKYLVSLRKKYNPIKESISNSSTLENTLNELSMAKNKYEKTIALVTNCRQERKAKGWEEKGGPNSNLTASGIADKFPTTSGTEQDIFCDAPIKGGYNHKSFTHENDGSSGAFGAILGGYLGAITGGIGIIPGILIGRALGNKPDGIVTHPDVPYVNAKDVLKWRGSLGVFGHSATMKLSCDLIYNTQIVDYKRDLPGLTPVIEAPIIVNDTDIGINLGICTLSDPATGEKKFTESEVSKEDCDSVNGSTWTQSQPEAPINNNGN